MKKFLTVLITFCALLLVACSSSGLKDEEKINLEGRLGVSLARNLRYIKGEAEDGSEDIDELGAKVESEKGAADGDSFVLFVYLGNDTDEYLDVDDNGVECTGCQVFYKNVLQPFIEKYNVMIYSCYYKYAYQYTKSTYRRPHNNAPKLIVFKDGQIVGQESREHNKEVFTSEEGLLKFMDKYAVLPTMLEVDEQQLDTLLTDGENKVIYYGWRACPDCQYFEKYYLPTYLREHKDGKKWYYFDTDKYRSQKKSNPELWEAFVEKIGINLKDNGGKVPTFAYYENNQLVDAGIFFNDIDGDNKVTSSYYEDAPFIGQTFASYEDYQKQTGDFYYQKFVKFMNEHNA